MIDKAFLTAGKAVFTMAGPDRHYTYKIKFKAGKAGRRDVFWVYLLTGPDNQADYTYMGVYEPKQGFVRVTQASSYQQESQPVKVINWGLKVIDGRIALRDGYSIHHEDACGRCARPLTDPISCETGIGPDCRKKMAKALAIAEAV